MQVHPQSARTPGNVQAAGSGAMVARPMATASPAPAVTSERDLRLDLFRGVALWLIFLDHIPENVANWFTIRNYGFSDATEIFIFISGYTAAFVYGRAMRERGFLLSSARILKRAWQIYVAHIFLFTIFMAEIAYVAATFDNPLYAEEMKILDFLKQPDVTIFQALLLKFKPVNMDVLPLYIVLLLLFPPMLQLLLRSPNFALAGSAAALRPDLEVRLQPARLSERRMVLQSLRLAVAVRVRRLVRARRRAAACRRAALPRGTCDRRRLPFVCLRHHLDVAFRAARAARADLAERSAVSHRQDQSRRPALCPFSRAGGGNRPLRPAGLAGLEIADFCCRRSAAASIRWKSSASACFSPLPANSSSPSSRGARCCRRRSAC